MNLILKQVASKSYASQYGYVEKCRNEKAEEDDYPFLIGRIIKATKTKVVMQHFDADGIWQEELYEVPYTKITSVSFGTRYVDTFSKYL